jgi:hypothetical protein
MLLLQVFGVFLAFKFSHNLALLQVFVALVSPSTNSVILFLFFELPFMLGGYKSM